VAGLAGLIKAIFILERGLIPANLHFKTPNPNIPFDQWNIKVPTSTTEWRSKGIRRISVNSFGFAGANAHAIIEDKESYLAERKRRGRLSMTTIFSSTNGHASSKVNGEQSLSAKRLFVLTGNDLNSLRRQRLQLSTYVQQQSAKFAKDIFQTDKFLSDLAFTLSEKRSRLPWKSSCAASTIKQLVNNLEAGDFTAIRSKSERPQVGFVFTGQGAQWARMGIELLQYHVFRKTVEAANKHLGELGCQWSIVEELCQDEKISKLADPLYSQTICTVLQIALVDLMSSWGVRPKSVVGHSSGEIAAAYSFGALKRSDACKIAYYRGVLSSQVVQTSSTGIKGAMMAVGCSEFQARESIKRLNCGKAIVACINSPISVTISGDESAIDELHGTFQKEGIFARKLKVETAYHSHHMTPIAGSYFEALRDIETLEARQDCEMFSSVMGRGVDASELGAAYWARNLVSPVLFSDAVNQMFSQVKTGGSAVIDTVVEIGPHAALRGPVMQTLKHFNIPEMAYHSIVVRGQDGIQTALSCGEALFGLGVSVDIHAINNSAKPADNYNSIENPKQLMNLPGYPWDHSHSYWSESRVSIQHRNRALPRLSLVGAPYPSLGQHERQWRTFLRITEEPWIQDHKMQSSILYPAAGFIAMTIEATRQIADPGKTPHAFRLREIKIDTAVLMNEDVDVECVLQMRPHATGPWFEFNISTSTSGMDLQQNCSGLIVIEYKSDSESEIESAMTSERRLENEMTRKRYHEIEVMCSDVEDPRSFYRELESAGMNYGPTFQNVIQIHHGSGHSCCTVVIGDTGCDPVVPVSNRDNPHAQPHIIHPTVLDSIFQTAFAALKSELGPIKEALVPNAIAEISVLANISFAAGSQFRGYTKCSKHGFKDVLADISMLDDGLGEEVIGIKGFRCTGTGVATGDGMEEAGARNLCSKFTWKPAIAFLSTEEQKELVEAAISAETADNLRRKATREKTEAYKSICYALQSVEVKDIASTQLRTFYQWMQAQKEIYESHMVSLHDVEITGEVLSLEQNSTTSIKSRDLAGILLGKKSSLSPELDEESFLDQHLRNVRGMDVSMTKLSLVSILPLIAVL
jgi:acyl transferase domain-containing protein